MNRSTLFDCLDSLVQRQLDGDLSHKQHAQLESLLEEDSAARQMHIYIMLQHVTLRRLLGNQASAPLPESVEADRVLAESAGGTVEPKEIGAAHSKTALFGRPFSTSLIAAAAVVGLLLTMMAFVAAPQFTRNHEAAEKNASARVIANVTGVHNARWSKGRTAMLGTQLIEGYRIELASGFIEVTYDSGTVVLLEGPCAVALNDSGRCWLERGRMTARVPSHAVGFTVDTPHGRIVDLGTEFGVEVLEDWLHVAVFQGKVRARSNGGSERLLVAGDRARIISDSIASSNYKRDQHPFTQDLPGRPTPLALSGCDVESDSDPPWILNESWNGFTDSHDSFRPRAGREMLWASTQNLPANLYPRYLRAEIRFDSNEHTISAGEYRLAIDVGKSLTQSSSLTQLITLRLTDVMGTELPGRANVDVSPPQDDHWTTYVVKYAVPPESELIGKGLRLELVGIVPKNHTIYVDNVAIFLEEPSSE